MSDTLRFPTRTAAVNLETLMRGKDRIPKVLRQMGYKSLREGQEGPILNIMGQRDTICILPTSVGKTAVFVIPTLALEWRTLVFSPLVALMRDQVKGLQKMDIRAGQMSGMQTDAENALAIRQWMSGELQFLYVAPERLQNQDFKEAIRINKPDMVVLDECFPGDYFVDTEYGPRCLEDLWMSHQAGHALPRARCINEKTGEMLMRPILRVMQRGGTGVGSGVHQQGGGTGVHSGASFDHRHREGDGRHVGGTQGAYCDAGHERGAHNPHSK